MTKSDFSARAMRDKIVIQEPERFVQLRITLNGVSATLLCPHDFDEVIEALRTCSVGAESVQLNNRSFETQLESLGLIRRATRGNWNPTSLLREHAHDLIKAFRQRQEKIFDIMDKA